MDLRTFDITRIDIFRGRTADTLNRSELQGLRPWMAKVQERWKNADTDLRRHFTALLLQMKELGMGWELSPDMVLPDLDVPEPPNSEVPSTSPRVEFKLPMSLAPLQSQSAELPVVELRPTPIAKPSIVPASQVFESKETAPQRRDETQLPQVEEQAEDVARQEVEARESQLPEVFSAANSRRCDLGAAAPWSRVG
jgi:hypothetical protein